jgi:hypothetical protein
MAHSAFEGGVNGGQQALGTAWLHEDPSQFRLKQVGTCISAVITGEHDDRNARRGGICAEALADR